MDNIDSKYEIYDFIKNNNDIEKVATYICNLFPKSSNLPDIISRAQAKVGAKRLLSNGLTVEQILSGDADREIFYYIDDLRDMIVYIVQNFGIKDFEAVDVLLNLASYGSFNKYDMLSGVLDSNIEKMCAPLPDELRNNNVLNGNEKQKYVPLETRKKIVPLNLTIAIIGAICIIGTSAFAYKNAKIDSKAKEDSLDLAYIAGLNVENGNLTEQFRVEKSGSYNGYDYRRIAYNIVEGIKKDHSLFEYYMFDTFRNINSDRKVSSPLVLIDKIYKEVKMYFYNIEELSDVRDKLANSDTFLEWLYNSAFIPHTDSDYKELLNDIYKYKTLIIAGDPDPMQNNNFSEASKRRIQKLVSAFLSHKHNAMLQDEFGEVLDNFVTDDLGGRSQ